MTEMVRRFLGQKLGSVGLWIALAALAVVSALPLTAGRSAGITTALACFVIAGGIVSRDVASGALQMILSRPVLRAEYLVGRYVGAIVVLSGYFLGTLLIALVLNRFAATVVVGAPTHAFSWSAALSILAQELPKGMLDVAMLLFFSTFLRGFGDVLAFLLFFLFVSILPQIGLQLGLPSFMSIAHFLTENLAPDGPWQSMFQAGRSIWQVAAGQWMVALAAYLLAAVGIFNQREFSYGQD